MKSLLWKEWREKRLWTLLLLASTVGILFLGSGYTFCGEGNFDNGLMIISILTAFIFGASSYTSEISGGTADFLYSRPTSWKKIVLAKLIVGIGIIAAASILSAITYRLICPAPYVEFATLSALCRGIGLALMYMGELYLAGFICSVVLPGIIGSILTFLIVLIAYIVEIYFVAQMKGYHFVIFVTYLSGFSWVASMFLAAILTVRFGLTLSLGTRVKRFVLIVLCGVTITCIVGCIVYSRTNYFKSDPLQFRLGTANVSPDGKYLIIGTSHYPKVHTESYYIIDIASKKKTIIFNGNYIYNTPIWISKNTLCFKANPSASHYVKKGLYPPELVIANVNKNLKLSNVKVIDNVKVNDYDKVMVSIKAILSPDKHLLLVVDLDRRNCTFEIVDIDKRIIIKSWTQKDNRGVPWWQSDNQIGYLDINRKTHIINIEN